MSTDSFYSRCKSNCKEYLSYDDGTAKGAASAAFSIINVLPAKTIIELFVSPAYFKGVDQGNGGLAMLCYGCGAILGFIPACCVFIGLLPLGILSALGGLCFGGVRNCSR